jgi:hypothetical protein
VSVDFHEVKSQRKFREELQVTFLFERSCGRHTHIDKDTHFWLHLMNVKSIAIVAVRGSVFVSFGFFVREKVTCLSQRAVAKKSIGLRQAEQLECCAPTDTPTRCLSPKDILYRVESLLTSFVLFLWRSS